MQKILKQRNIYKNIKIFPDIAKLMEHGARTPSSTSKKFEMGAEGRGTQSNLQ